MHFGHPARLRALSLMLFSLAGCEGVLTGEDEAPSRTTGEADLGPSTAVTFAPSTISPLNPERGRYVGIDLLAGDEGEDVRADGYGLALAIVRLDDHRGRALPSDLLDDLAGGLGDARLAGVKVILRFVYNSSVAADAPRERILGHIDQLEPILRSNADVIAVMQAGFIGAWGEWHGSTNGLENDADRAEILDALLAALPSDRSVQVRTPMYKDAAFPGGPTDADEARAGVDRARVGLHNDCFLASHSDLGTFASPVDAWLDYVSEDGRYTPVGGETCKVNAPRTDCGEALAALAAQHFSYLNDEYHRGVLAQWENQGCADEIDRRLGYRLAMTAASHTATVAPGGAMALDVQLTNTGFAAPFNPRPLHVVLRRNGQRWIAPLPGSDARTLQPGTSTVSARLRLPADLAPGTYQVALWLPDPGDLLQRDPRFAIQLANDGAWDPSTGDNVVSGALVVAGTPVGTATVFEAF